MILDTNGLTALAEGDVHLTPILDDIDEIEVPVIVLGEYRYGIKQSKHRARYEEWLMRTIANCRILNVDEGTADQYAEIRFELKHRGRPIPGNDLWIAALTRQHDLPLISRDEHFDVVPKLTRIAW